jgi:hypothetical protein
VLHAALREYDPTAAAQLVAFDGSSVNDWYESLGFEAVGPAEPGFIAGHELSTTTYRTPRELGIGGVIANLEAKRPWLAEGRLVS